MNRSLSRSLTRSFVRATLANLAVAYALAAPAVHAVTVTRGPYLQIPTPAGIILRWRTDVPTDGRVRYGAGPGSLTLTADDPTVTTEHLVPLSGLSADTLYYYSIGSVGGALVGDDVDHHLRTSPTPGPSRPMRIWVTGDGGFADANGMAVRDAYAAYNFGNPTDLWLLLGDNAYFDGADTDYQAALFDMHHDLLRQVAPWPTFGNHEALSSNSGTQTGPYFDMFSLPTAGEAGGVASGTEAYYAFDYANVHFIVLDSQGASTLAGSPMMLWLEADLQAATADWLIAFWHHPPYSKGTFHDSDVEGRLVRMRTNVLPMLETYGVDLVLCGHSHSYERSPFLDGHYGLSTTFTPAMSLDSGDGNPSGDGPYRKPDGQNPHEGAVYVVAGSSSETRPLTASHPAILVGLEELGSLVLDLDGDTVTGTFLNSLGQTPDTFTLVKGPACPATPRSGCGSAPKGRLVLKDQPGTGLDKLVWRWKGGALPVTQVGAPDDQTDLAFCLYDASGQLLGGTVSHGADPAAGTSWTRTPTGRLAYKSTTASEAGIEQLRVKPTGSATLTALVVRGSGTALALPALPRTLPLTAQLANLDGGACWESVFTTAKKNEPVRVLADLP